MDKFLHEYFDQLSDRRFPTCNASELAEQLVCDFDVSLDVAHSTVICFAARYGVAAAYHSDAVAR